MADIKHVKGEVVIIKTRDGFKIYGIIYALSGTQMTIAHNFDGIDPIDTTTIDLKDIEMDQVVKPSFKH